MTICTYAAGGMASHTAEIDYVFGNAIWRSIWICI